MAGRKEDMRHIEKMLYKRYKQHFADCQTVPGSYNEITKTIDVILPEGRMKPSGVRGQSYKYMHFDGVESLTGRKVNMTIKATCLENAIKRLPKDCTWEL